MSFDGMMLGVYHLPKIEVDSGTDWVTLFGFILTAIAVISGSLVTVWTFRGTVKSQEELAKKVSLSQSRQEWINDLRTSCADFIAAVMLQQSMLQNNMPKVDHIEALKLTDSAAAAQIVESITSSLSDVRFKAFSLRARLLLLSNPAEPDFIRMAAVIEECMHGAEVFGFNIMAPCNELTRLTQQILKKEWDRAKQMT